MGWVDDDDDARVAAVLRRDAALHVYALGDLDPFYRPLSRFALGDGVALVVYEGFDPPVLLALARPADLPALRALLAGLVPDLPRRLYVHASPGALDGLALARRVEHGPHLKMTLAPRTALVGASPPAGLVRLGPDDLPRVQALFAVAHPANAFEPRSLATGVCHGLEASPGGPLVAAAGVHVVSAAQGVAAIGNVATHPAHRGRGLARAVTASVVRALPPEVEVVSLNVARENAAAIRCYAGLGFRIEAPYDEVEVELVRI